MDETEPLAPEPAPANAAARRKGPPLWGIVAFLVLLGGLAIVNQLVSSSGQPVAWIENDLDAALAKAAAAHKRVFLYLYEANNPVHARNEREVFSQRWARQPLSKVVCCRVALTPGNLLRIKYPYRETPLFLLLDENGRILSQLDGDTVDETQFRTHIGGPASRAH